VPGAELAELPRETLKSTRHVQTEFSNHGLYNELAKLGRLIAGLTDFRVGTASAATCCCPTNACRPGTAPVAPPRKFRTPTRNHDTVVAQDALV
jgi:hypothetical protein